MQKLKSLKPFYLVLFLLFFISSVQGQTLYCNITKEEIQDALDSRKGSPILYSDNVTTGITFLLSQECNDALNYFDSALHINSTPSVLKIVSKLNGGKKNVVRQEEIKPSIQDSTVKSSVEPIDSLQGTERAEIAAAADIKEPTSNSNTENNNKTDKSFSEDELKSFQEKGLIKVKKLLEYIEIIAQKKTAQTTALGAIESSIKLFTSENHIVQVSSNTRPGAREFPVRTYLNRVRMLDYQKVIIEGAAFSYVSSFKMGPDGNYYGIAKFQQKFKGFKENQAVYEDVTTKTVAVVLKPYQKSVDGESIEMWDVFLGDIQVQDISK